MAAHLIIRERRPDTLPGILLAPFTGYTSRIQKRVAGRPFQEIVDTIRHGPPLWSPYYLGPVDNLVNTMEYFIHHEDLRRAQPDWEPRQLDAGLERALWSRFRLLKGLLLRKVKVSLRVEPVGFRPIGPIGGAANRSGNTSQLVTISGPPSELIMFATGRKDHAQVEVRGSDDAVAILMKAPMGI